METYTITRTVKMDNSWDVIVVGGGPSGCAAAIAAAREGARVLVVEATGCLGGMGTSGLVPTWCPFTDKEKIVYRGIALKILNLAKKDMLHVDENKFDWVPINSEILKRVYDTLVIDSGASVLFNSQLSAVDTDENGNVRAVIISNKDGLTAYCAKVYVDCTGDGDLAAWAGAEFIKGDLNTGELQPATHCFTIGNVDEYAYGYGASLHSNNKNSVIYDILSSGKYNLIEDSHICDVLVAPGTVGFNAGHIWDVDNTSPMSTSKALIKGRRLAEEMRMALSEFYPGAFSNSFVAKTGNLIGARETRRILGEYVLTANDYMQRKSFEDEIGRNCYYIDVHRSYQTQKKAAESRDEIQEYYVRYGAGESHGIPYRCLTPKGLKNVLVAGRSISCERLVLGSVRVMPVCLTTGEAAGLAAALVAKHSHGVDVHRVDVRLLRTRLKEEGAYIL